MKPVFPQKVRLAQIPTPIQPLKRLSEVLGGPEIFIKRDDLTGSGLSGNKVRKLEFVFAEALAQNADTVITCGGIGSNHARATAVAARQLGLRPILVLRGQPGQYPDGNPLLDSLLDAEIHFISREAYANSRNEIMADLAKQAESRGHRAYVIPEGASFDTGVWGYVNAFYEILDQMESQSPAFDAIVTAVGSGGTQAGLLVGKTLSGWNGDIFGINVCDDAFYFKERISAILSDFSAKYAVPLSIDKDAIQLIDGYVGRGYALSQPKELDVIKTVARLEGIFLDPTYTGKAMFGLIDQIKKGRFTKGQRILFLHTGGIFGLFPKRAMFFGGLDAPEFPEENRRTKH